MVYLCFLAGLILTSGLFGQTPTTVFSDDFERTTPLSGGTPTMTYSFTGSVATAAVSCSSLTATKVLQINNGTSSPAKTTDFVMGTLSTFSTPFNTTFSSNPGVVTWSFNVESNNNSTGTFGTTGVYAVGVVLGSTNSTYSSFLTSGTGYAVVSTVSKRFDLVKFTNGLYGTLSIIAQGTAGNSSTNWRSIKVTYDPTTNNWSLFVRDDGNAAPADPITGSGAYVQQGSTTADNTYTGTAMTSFAYAWCHNNSTNKFALYDNFKCSVTASLPTLTLSATSLTSFGNLISGTNSASANFTVSGTNLSDTVTVTAPTNFAVSTDDITYSSYVTLNAAKAATLATTTIYARFSPASASGSNTGNITISTPSGTYKSVAVSGFSYATEPTANSSISFGLYTGQTIPVNLTLPGSGAGTNRIVVVRQGSAVSWAPTDLSAISGVNANFSLATDQDGNGNKVVYDGTASGTNVVTVTNLSPGIAYYFATYEYNIGSAASTQNYLSSSPGTGSQTTAQTPTISLTGSLTGFGNQVINSASAEQSYSVSGAYLTSNILITPPAGFEISTGTGVAFTPTSPITLVPASGIVAATTIYVRFKPNAVTSFSGNIAHTSTGALQQDMAVTGTGLDHPATVLSSNDPAVSAGSMGSGSTKNQIYAFNLAVTNSPATLNQVSFTTGGTYAAADMAKFQLWYNAANVFSGAAQVGADITADLEAGSHSFTGLTQSIAAGATGYFWITVDVAATPTVGNTINVDAITTANLTLADASGAKSGTAFAGGVQTIILQSNTTDYYRSKASGDWATAATWQSSPDNSNWHDATLAPTSAAVNVNIQSGHVVACTSAVTVGNSTVSAGGELAINTGATLTTLASTTLTVNGTLTNSLVGNAYTLNGTLAFSATGVYNLTTVPGSASGVSQIPTATWATGSTLKIAIGSTGSTTADYTGLTGVRQTFSNVIVDCPNLNNKLLLLKNAGTTTAPFMVISNVFTVASTGSGTGLQILSSGNNNNNLNVGSYVQTGGKAFAVQNAGSAANRSFNIAGNLTINGGVFDLANTTGSTATNITYTYVGGNITVASGATLQQTNTAGTLVKLVLNGTGSDQVITNNGTITSGVIIEVNKASNNVKFGSDLTFNGSLTLTAGKIVLGANNLILGATSTVSGASAASYIVQDGTGELRKTFTADGSFTFPLGNPTGTAEYSPLAITLSGGTYSSAYVAAKVNNSKYSLNGSATDYLNRYWTVSATGITGYTATVTGTYLATDVAGTEANLYGGVYGTSWTALPAVNATAHTFTGTGLTALGVFTAGELNAMSGLTSITITLLPEGYANNYATNLAFPTEVFTVHVASASSPYADIESHTMSINPATLSGTVVFTTLNSGTYYLYITHPNSLETWSKAGGEVITAGAPFSYDFTSAQTQAYGSQLKLISGKYCLYSGDVDGSKYIDNNDLLLIDNDAFAYKAGTNITDLDGTQYVDNNDLLICDNNAFNFIGTKSPQPSKMVAKPETKKQNTVAPTE